VLEEVRYFPTTVALVEYDRSVFSAEVRALAMDDGPCSNAGAYGQTDRHIVRYTFSGRDARIHDPSPAQIDEWIDGGEEQLQAQMPIARGAQRVAKISRHWTHGYCGYVPFHGRFLGDVRRGLADAPGLALAGDYLLGVSIEACVRSGLRAAESLTPQLDRVPAR